MPDEPLTPATREDLLFTLTYGLTHTESGKPHRRATDLTARIAAETLVRHLELSGYVVMKKPPARQFTTPRSGA